jgi:hypothetical protein
VSGGDGGKLWRRGLIAKDMMRRTIRLVSLALCRWAIIFLIPLVDYVQSGTDWFDLPDRYLLFQELTSALSGPILMPLVHNPIHTEAAIHRGGAT